MGEGIAGAVNPLTGKGKVDVGNAMPIARVLRLEDARDLTVVPRYY